MRAMWRLAAGALLLAGPAPAQRPGCGFGLGLEALRAAEAALRPEPASLAAGRAAGGVAADQLRAAAARLAGCGCPRAAEQAGEAAGIAEETRAEAGRERLRRLLDRAGFAAGEARARLDRQGCS